MPTPKSSHPDPSEDATRDPKRVSTKIIDDVFTDVVAMVKPRFEKHHRQTAVAQRFPLLRLLLHAEVGRYQHGLRRVGRDCSD